MKVAILGRVSVPASRCAHDRGVYAALFKHSLYSAIQRAMYTSHQHGYSLPARGTTDLASSQLEYGDEVSKPRRRRSTGVTHISAVGQLDRMATEHRSGGLTDDGEEGSGF
ncbi:hypothetical protein EXIGLDRAFT_716885 [Exidia glandulosa HHB12029]|uniref:Uncharacterized protein n=1 Tax=Exidia glandulosa HHB12029 TaxID=1314781 RepID=A0A165IND5_EXIGL|nr:hypothetical protein EXIGLDRAFT_716885 [Exidia glandulosa HHB12029]